MLEIHEPVFLIGSGRSGTTWFARMLAAHPDLGYFSSWTSHFPGNHWLAIASRLNDIDLLEARMRYTRKWPCITEGNDLWEKLIPGFSDPNTDLCAQDATEDQREHVRACVQAHLRWQGKSRFLGKYVGYPRIELMRCIFPDAHFVCLDRDPRAVVFSQMQLQWGFEHRPDVWERMSDCDRLRYYAEGYLRYQRDKQRFEAGKDYRQYYYEDLIADPVGKMHEICLQVNLPVPKKFLDRIGSWRVNQDANQRWQQHLSGEQIALLNTWLAEPLREMGIAVYTE